MPFKPFTAASTNHPKGKPMAPQAKGKPVFSDPKKELAPPAAKKNSTRVPRPSGAGPAGSAGYFDAC